MPNADPETQRRRWNNCLADYKLQLEKLTEIRTIFDADQHDRHYLRRKITVVESLMQSFKEKADLPRDSLDEEPQLRTELCNKTISFNELSNVTFAVLKRFMEQVTPRQNNPPPPPPPPTPKCRLPKIALTTFDGNPADWYNYKESFNNLVKDNAELDDTQRMALLSAMSAGTAAALVVLVPGA
jgi:hypothetical protein